MNFDVFLRSWLIFGGFLMLFVYIFKGMSLATCRLRHAIAQLRHLNTSEAPKKGFCPKAVRFHYRFSRLARRWSLSNEQLEPCSRDGF